MGSDQSGREDFWSILDRFLWILSLITFAILVILYLVVAGQRPTSGDTRIYDLTLSIISNLIPVLVVFAATYTLFRQFGSQREKQKRSEMITAISNETRQVLGADLQKTDSYVNHLEETMHSEFRQLRSDLQLLEATISGLERRVNVLGDSLSRLEHEIRFLKDDIVRKIADPSQYFDHAASMRQGRVDHKQRKPHQARPNMEAVPKNGLRQFALPSVTEDANDNN